MLIVCSRILNFFKINGLFLIYTEPELVNLLIGTGIDSQPGLTVRQPYLMYRPARLAESIPGRLKRLKNSNSVLVLVNIGAYLLYLHTTPSFQYDIEMSVLETQGEQFACIAQYVLKGIVA
jgi:hypothetical protein